MRFYFLHNDEYLRRPASQGGCGVTEEEIRDVTVWQNDRSYQFEFHLENHGPYVYIFPDGRRAGQPDMPRYYFGGGRRGMFDNEKSISAAVQRDVSAVVGGNMELFGRMHARFYGLGGVAKKVVEVKQVPAVAYFECLNPKCVSRNQVIAVRFASQVEMHRLIRVSNIGGIRSSEYPVIKCPRSTCGISLEMVEFGSATARNLAPKEVIEYGAK